MNGSAAFQFLYITSAINGNGLNNEAFCEFLPKNTALVVHLTAKGVLPVVHY